MIKQRRLALTVAMAFGWSSSVWAQAQPPIKINFDGLSKRCESAKDPPVCKRGVSRWAGAYDKMTQAKDGDVLKRTVEAKEAENDFKQRYPEVWAKRFD